MDIHFAGYTFSFWLLTGVNRYEPEGFEITETGDGIIGLHDLYAELNATFPTLQFAGEAPVTEITASLVSLICGIPIVETAQLGEIYRTLFVPYCRNYGYNQPPEPYRGVWGAPPLIDPWSQDRYLRYVERSEWVCGIPSLNLTDRRIRLDGELVKVVLEQARKYRMCL